MPKVAEEQNADVRTVRRIWGRVQRWTRAALNPSDVEAMRVRQVMRLEANIAAAAAAGQYGAAFKGEQVYGQLTGTIAAAKVEVSGGYSVTHSAAIARVSQMSLPELLAEIDELEGMQRRVIEGSARPCGVTARGVYADGVGLPPCRSCFLILGQRDDNPHGPVHEKPFTIRQHRDDRVTTGTVTMSSAACVAVVCASP